MSAKTYTSPQIGNGYQLIYTSPASATTSTVAGWIHDIKGGLGVGIKEWSTLASTAVRRMPTIVDNDDFSGTIAHLPGDQTNLDFQGLMNAPATIPWQIKSPDGALISFNGILHEFSPSFPDQDEVTADFSIAVDGAVTFTAPTS